MNKYRIFVEKKAEFGVDAQGLLKDLNESLGLGLAGLRIVNVYDIFGASAEELEVVKRDVLSEVVTDMVTDELDLAGKVHFAVEFVPGQYDQRADSAEQCLMLLTKNEEVTIKSGKVIIIDGASTADLDRIKGYYINPIEMREKNLDAPLGIDEVGEPASVLVHEGFNELDAAGLTAFLVTHGMAMTLADIKFIQDYFKDEERRNPTETELKVLDTYWSDHCRHTTFETVIKDVVFEEGALQETLQAAFEQYVEMRRFVHGEKKPMTLMDMATIVGKEQRKLGTLDDMEITDEINACSVYIDVDVDGTREPWLLMFKNETHNHPTEIEPFGGASTCVGGAIRDPLSGRSYVYQAMRISGGADILEPIEATTPGKLPQKIISKVSADGNSSYGNQIGLATTFVREIYHEGYRAKHMEVGAVVAAAPAQNVVRAKPEPGDSIILLGGRTGRDGIGGATGSSKVQDDTSIETAASEVQKGNAPVERKIQRLFREEKVTTLIKKCNDFGAGGVSVAIGELADGLNINLNAVPLKYAGLNGTEIAISESQERMAVVIDSKDVDVFTSYAAAENLEAVVVAKVTDDNRLTIHHNGVNIVDLSRDFIDTNGVTGSINIIVPSNIDIDGLDKANALPLEKGVKERFLANLAQPNVASQQGMVEMFDSNVGAGSVLMPYGGKYQLTETEGSVHKIPVRFGQTDTASLLTYGYNAELSSLSPFHGAAYAVVESIAKIVALGGKWQGIRFSFQEYFKRLEEDPKKWGEPFAALLGAVHVQKEFGLPAIGGKDSMSGSFEDLHVPPTLISFAVQTEKASQIISSEFKNSGNYVYLVKHKPLADGMPDIARLKANFDCVYEKISQGTVKSAFTVKQGGLAEAVAKMTFGNHIGVKLDISSTGIFDKNYGSIVIETSETLTCVCAELIGRTIDEKLITFTDMTVTIEEAIAAWQGTFEGIYPVATSEDKSNVEAVSYERVNIKTAGLGATPKVIIPAFPGTNSEYDSARAFEAAGAKSTISVFANRSATDIDVSIKRLATHINSSQILMLPGGFSAGDEPDGSGKFITAILKNVQVRESIEGLLERDGLIIGICNGFQALVKSGLLPYGKIGATTQHSPTLFTNNIGRHQSKIARTRATGANSPWLTGINAGDIHNVVISHGEGKFVANDAALKQLIENGQIAFQYADVSGNPTMDEIYNPNGSTLAIEGIISPDGKILGKMGHTERSGQNIFKNVEGNYDQKIFVSGVEYFKK